MIRKFKSTDAPKCTKIMIDCIKNFDNYNNENKEFLIKMSQPEHLIEKSKKTEFYVYEKEGNIIGTGVFDRGEIRTMFVDPIHQKKGVGSEILNFLINLAKFKGYRRVFLRANPQAEFFYAKNGFKKISEKEEFNFKTIEMEKQI